MKISVYHNVATDEAGRHIAMADGYQDGHPLVLVAQYERDGDQVELLDDAFRLFNVGEDPTFGKPDPIARLYRYRRNRSLSVGDVVALGDQFYACANGVGWTCLEKRPHILDLRGTHQLIPERKEASRWPSLSDRPKSSGAS